MPRQENSAVRDVHTIRLKGDKAMCLEKILATDLDEEGEGYKVYEMAESLAHTGELVSPVFNCYMKEGRWCRVSQIKMIKSDEGRDVYPCGFHIFESYEGARSLEHWAYRNAGIGTRIWKVRYRKGHTIGTETWGDKTSQVIVAREIYVYPKNAELEPEEAPTEATAKQPELVGTLNE